MTLAAEFPNDNPDLHEGTIWVCLDVTGEPVAERRLVAAEVAAPCEPEIVAELAPPQEPEIVEEAPPPAPRESGIFMTFSSLMDHPEIGDALEGDETILVEELSPLDDVAVEIVVAAEMTAELDVAVAIEEAAPVEQTAASVEQTAASGEETAASVEQTAASVEQIAASVEQTAASVEETAASVEQIAASVEETCERIAPVVSLAPPPPDDPWVVFTATLVDVAIAHGMTAAAAELPAMLEGEKRAQAWAGILRGTSEDWDAVGGSMLDEWAADTLARVVGADAPILKRELRARGIAAFGLAA